MLFHSFEINAIKYSFGYALASQEVHDVTGSAAPFFPKAFMNWLFVHKVELPEKYYKQTPSFVE